MPLSDLQGRYINLDRAEDRRQFMEAKLATHGLDGIVTRFAAREGDDRPRGITRNELGCFLSHQEIVATADPARPLLVLEDDIHFPERAGNSFAKLFDSLHGHAWDMLFLAQVVSFADLRAVYHMLKLKRKAGDIYAPDFARFSIEPCKGIYVSGATAYLIRAEALPKVQAILNRAAEAGYQRSLDIVYLDAINRGEIDAKFLFPYLLGVDPRFQSTINDRPAEANAPLFMDMMNMFVAGGDIDYLRLRAFDAQHDGPFDIDAFIASQLVYRRLAR